MFFLPFGCVTFVLLLFQFLYHGLCIFLLTILLLLLLFLHNFIVFLFNTFQMVDSLIILTDLSDKYFYFTISALYFYLQLTYFLFQLLNSFCLLLTFLALQIQSFLIDLVFHKLFPIETKHPQSPFFDAMKMLQYLLLIIFKYISLSLHQIHLLINLFYIHSF